LAWNKLKAIFAFLCLLVCVTAHGTLPVYADLRAFVEGQAVGNPTPATNRIFVAFERRAGVVVPHRGGIKLEDVIKQSGLKTTEVFVFVFRGARPGKAGAEGNPVYDSRDTKTKTSDFIVRPLDAIYLVDMKTAIN
jgi:hypothetical protein